MGAQFEKGGGGDVPICLPASVFLYPVAAGVLRRRPHVLELNGQHFLLTVKAADPAQVSSLLLLLLPARSVSHLSSPPDGFPGGGHASAPGFAEPGSGARHPQVSWL